MRHWSFSFWPHLAWSPLGPSMLLRMALFPSFGHWIVFYCIFAPHLQKRKCFDLSVAVFLIHSCAPGVVTGIKRNHCVKPLVKPLSMKMHIVCMAHKLSILNCKHTDIAAVIVCLTCIAWSTDPHLSSLSLSFLISKGAWLPAHLALTLWCFTICDACDKVCVIK